MLNLKKTAVAVLALGSSAVFAGTMGPVCTPGNVTVPCETTAWDFGVYALYLQPAGADRDSEYHLNALNAQGATIAQVDATHDADLDWDWGFKLEGSYHFSTGNDLNLNWSHLKVSGDRDDGASTLTYTVEPNDLTDPHGSLSADWSSELKWDAVNFEFGQHVDFGEFKDIRFHAGLQYAHVDHDVDSVGHLALGTTSTAAVAYALDGDGTFNALGPRVGMDMIYNFNNGFAIHGNGAAAILAGHTTYNATAVVGPTSATLLTLHDSKSAIVPEFDVKLGATYTYAMAQGELSLDAGWMFVDYIMNNHFNDQTVAFGSADHSFGLQGPYAGLKWVGNV